MTFGTVVYSERYWLIKTEPQVSARLKRVFPRAPQYAAEMIRLSASPENSRELLWFLQRYPMEMDVTSELALKRLSQEHVVAEERLADLLSGRRPPERIELAKPARGYQLEAAAALPIKKGLLLADDVGLGKTVSALLPMAKAENLPAVVVVPAHLPDHWAEKLPEFLPDLRVHVIKKGQPYSLIRERGRRSPTLWDRLPDVIVISYHKLRGWAETLAPITRYVVFEECQQLRNPNSDIAYSCRHLAESAPLRMGLSATPIYNYGSEFFHVMDVLSPGALGTRDEFLREWCGFGGGDKARLNDSERFGAYLRREGLMLRRTRKEVGRELPPLTKVVHTVESDTKVLESLSGTAVELARTILSRNERFKGEHMQASGEFDRILRQATGIAKAPYVAEFVRLLVESGEKVLLFGWHRAVYDIWMEKLADLNPVLYTGTESAIEKRAAKEAFVRGSAKVMMMSLRSGAGVDGLQHVCSTVVFGELDWSPGVHEQCIGRVDRDEQTTPVMAYFVTSDEGSDPIVVEVLGVKREQIEGVRNPGGPLAERIETGENTLRALAMSFLKARGEAVPEAEVLELVTESLEEVA